MENITMEENELEKVKTKDKTQTLVAIFEDNTIYWYNPN